VAADLVASELDRVHARIAGRFARSEPRPGHGSTYLGWSQAWNGRTAGRWPSGRVRPAPTGCSGCWRWAEWDVDGVRDDLRDYVIEQPDEPGRVLIADEAGFLKKGPARPGCSGSTPARIKPSTAHGSPWPDATARTSPGRPSRRGARSVKDLITPGRLSSITGPNSPAVHLSQECRRLSCQIEPKLNIVLRYV
jgi:hypothetical protein